MFITPNDEPIAYVKTDLSSKLGLAICLSGTLLLGIVSYFYSYIQQFAYGLF